MIYGSRNLSIISGGIRKYNFEKIKNNTSLKINNILV